jgi:hypothetical protein
VHAHIHPTPVWFTALLAIGSVNHHNRAQCLGWCRLHGHHCTESPFAPFGVLPRRGLCTHNLDRRYPILIATTSSCARPHPSHGLRTMAWSASLCRLLRAPAGKRSFPKLSPQSVWRCLDPYPAALLRCACPFLPAEPRPHLTCNRFGALRLPP